MYAYGAHIYTCVTHKKRSTCKPLQASSKQQIAKMNDIILSSFLSLFALFGKAEQVDESRAKKMLASYLRHHFGIRNTDTYLNLYTDSREVYEMTDELDTSAVVASICEQLKGKISQREAAMLVLRLLEFSAGGSGKALTAEHPMFSAMAKCFGVSQEAMHDYVDYVSGRTTEHVLVHHLDDTEGELRTLLSDETGQLLFTYLGPDTVTLNDVPVLSGAYQLWLQSSVLKGRTGKPVYYSTIHEAHLRQRGEAVGQTSQVEFCGRNINFRYPNSDNGMHDMSFTLHSGELVAIMGGSGTGKTTLLSLLNGTLIPQQGTITINGHSIDEPEARDLIGYVPQDDLLIEELTVRQNLHYTARLCFAGMADDELERRVDKTLKDLGLDAVAHLKAGSPLNKYISGGQRKRLNIALELIRAPAVLFLDEPTSGLSSADTEKVVSLLKEQTLKGKLIVVNIHQPSSDVYKLFDRLWLLDRGGYPVFDGNPIDAITYFKTVADYADADTSACPTCGNVNPEIVLNIIDEKALTSSGEESDERKTTPEEWHALYLKNRPKLDEPDVSEVPPSDQRRPSRLKQFIIYLQRNAKAKVANLQYILSTALVSPLLAAICAMLTRYSPPEGYSVMHNKNLVSYLFMAVIVATFVGMSGSAEEIIKDRALLKRERFLRLSHGSYIWSKIVFLAGISALQTLLFTLVGNAIMGLHGLTFVWWLVLFVTAVLANLTGLLLSQCLSSVVAIYITIPLLLIPQILLCGLVVDFSDLTPRSTTGNVPLVGDVIPSRWSFEALAVTQFSDNTYEQPLFELHQQKHEAQWQLVGPVHEIQSQLETFRDEQRRGEEGDKQHMEIIRTNLPNITAFCGMKPYDGLYEYEPLKTYIDEAESILKKRGNQLTLAVDKKISAMVRELGKDAVLQIKNDNFNLKLEEIVTSSDQERVLDIVSNHFVPRTGAIYLTPQSKIGRAPFYSSHKLLGNCCVKTLWFNLAILLIMSIIAASLLFADCPGRWMRKDN